MSNSSRITQLAAYGPCVWNKIMKFHEISDSQRVSWPLCVLHSMCTPRAYKHASALDTEKKKKTTATTTNEIKKKQQQNVILICTRLSWVLPLIWLVNQVSTFSNRAYIRFCVLFVAFFLHFHSFADGVCCSLYRNHLQCMFSNMSFAFKVLCGGEAEHTQTHRDTEDKS